MPKFQKLWKLICKKDDKIEKEELERTMFERTFLRKLAEKFLRLIENIQPVDNQGNYSIEFVTYTERFMELLTDILVQLPTRRFFNVVLDDMNFLIRCSLSPYVKSLSTIENENEMESENQQPKKPSTDNGEEEQPTNKTVGLFKKMLTNLEFYVDFEINDATGETLSEADLREKHYEKMLQLQKAIFKHFRDEMPTLPLQNIRSIDERQVLTDEFERLSDEQLKAISSSLQPPIQVENRELLLELLVSKHERVQSHLEVIEIFQKKKTMFIHFLRSIHCHCLVDQYITSVSNRRNHLGRRYCSNRILQWRYLFSFAKIKSSISDATRLSSTKFPFISS